MNSIRRLRKENGMSQQKLAEILNVNQTAVSQWERGVTTPSSRMLLLLSKLFSVNPNDIIEDNYESSSESAWSDPNILEAVRESLPGQLSKLNDLIKECSAFEQKMVFDILVELSHILKLSDKAWRESSMSLLQTAFGASTRYVDVCVNSAADIDPGMRIAKAKQTALSEFDDALNEVSPVSLE